jgi:hypothetical protein
MMLVIFSKWLIHFFSSERCPEMSNMWIERAPVENLVSSIPPVGSVLALRMSDMVGM